MTTTPLTRLANRFRESSETDSTRLLDRAFCRVQCIRASWPLVTRSTMEAAEVHAFNIGRECQSELDREAAQPLTTALSRRKRA